EFVNKPVVENCKAKSSEEEPNVVRKNDDALIIEDRVSDDKEKDASQPKIEKKTVRHSNPQMDLQDQGVIDSRCSRHMTRNMSYTTDYEDIDGGYVAFGGNPKGGKIIGKCTIKTGSAILIDPRCKPTIIQPSTQPQKKQQPRKPKRKDTQRVKKLRKNNRSRTHRLKTLYKVGLSARVESSGVEESLGKDVAKQGRVHAIDADKEITLVSVQDDADKEMFDVDALNNKEVFVVEQEVAVKEVNNEVQNVVEEIVKVINTAKLIINAAQVSAAGDIVSTASILVSVVSAATTVSTAITTTFSLGAEQDSGNINKTQSKATPNESIS
nr:ribonuclease H-like domain-containing protein [Tanacetum cinerariifolium]